MVKRYEQPDAFLYDGRHNNENFFGNFDIREFIVEEKPPHL